MLYNTSAHALPIAGGLAGAASRNLLPVMSLRLLVPRGAIRKALWVLEDTTSWYAVFVEVA